ncbi:MAG: ATP phosphoribosyltransferase regulatory subunit [Methylicorpusculum sp.]|uniref:ATP phosphoribosyltransferase regulatory subunit n=1 Tax=Methylicorpusculum sp. TaxID=2713644 RepID=UPI00271C0E33|nr:ATP phosphoribosyltransferase regulatory subunit [Methylicorpusculum sp.]MDO8938222.1 ATP phosphoribosyltransferase regulatory subunit [Methylicorpusculum sp.]MDO9240056.1 ATP phosphoribosyltransferase regulatory subunit [Methylicorpusculum sp.]MDP2202153.1 ATP phosphoribosyltransferase regulatory subunit [Methylicorpusculum sp.]
MQQKKSWLLPEGIEEVLPEDAKRLENLRSDILSVFKRWGYQLVITPFIDFLDSLLTGSGHDLDLQTFKLTDQLSGEMLGIRADMTPQVARIDAHNLKHAWPTRLCYTGTVLHTVGDALEKSRSPMQIGAELYGHNGLESDLEIIQLMLEMLAISGIQHVHIDLGHVGIYRALCRQAELSKMQETSLFDILQRKAKSELQVFVQELVIDEQLKQFLLVLPELNGGRETLIRARDVLSKADETVNKSLQELTLLADRLAVEFPLLPISFDLAELRGYHYHTGIVFAAFVSSVGREIARGGRYDNIGAVFGRARPATGFSADLKVLSELNPSENKELAELIFAPAVNDSTLSEAVRNLRAAGRCVVQELPGQSGDYLAMGCTAVLEKNNKDWIVKALA